MNIKLPKKFYYTTSETSCAYVADGILYIKGYVNFEALMYTLTYTIYGYEKCRYCGSTLINEERTLDHIYPRGYGGVSITDNLLPCCIPCNQSKTDMAPYQYKEWQKKGYQGLSECYSNYDYNVKREDYADVFEFLEEFYKEIQDIKANYDENCYFKYTCPEKKTQIYILFEEHSKEQINALNLTKDINMKDGKMMKI